MLGLPPKYLLLLAEEGVLCPFLAQERAERVEGLRGAGWKDPCSPGK